MATQFNDQIKAQCKIDRLNMEKSFNDSFFNKFEKETKNSITEHCKIFLLKMKSQKNWTDIFVSNKTAHM